MYNTIVVAIDFFKENQIVLQRACELASEATKVHLLHVIEDPMPMYDAYTLPTLPTVDMEALRKDLEAKLIALGDKFGIPAEHCEVRTGSVSNTVIETAEELKADLIVAGSHGRHGIGLMLMGSTSSSILHHAKIDFLAVRVH